MICEGVVVQVGLVLQPGALATRDAQKSAGIQISATPSLFLFKSPKKRI